MEANIACRSKKIYSQVPSQPPLRAMIEIDGGQLRIYPIVDNDADERRVLDALRFIREDFQQ
jgi:hypothetical protein